MGAYLTNVISALGITPISKKCCRSAPSPPTLVTVAVFPIGNSLSFMLLYDSLSAIGRTNAASDRHRYGLQPFIGMYYKGFRETCQYIS